MASNFAAWKKTSAKGSEYLTVKGKCPECRCDIKANLFSNDFKKPGEKSPDYKEPAKPAASAAPPPAKADDYEDHGGEQFF